MEIQVLLNSVFMHGIICNYIFSYQKNKEVRPVLSRYYISERRRFGQNLGYANIVNCGRAAKEF